MLSKIKSRSLQSDNAQGLGTVHVHGEVAVVIIGEVVVHEGMVGVLGVGQASMSSK